MRNFLTFAAFAIIGVASASAAPFTMCPATGVDSSCEILISVTAVNGSGAATAWTISVDGTQAPYDSTTGTSNGDDTLVGIQNNSGTALKSITLTGTFNNPGLDGIFDFDNDGACSSSYLNCGGNSDSTGYGHGATAVGGKSGVAATFSGITGSVSQTGTVNFGGAGVAASGGTDWFSLEGPLAASSLVTPEPGSFLLLGTGLLGLLAARRRMRR